ncbi:MAG: glycosyltransferase [Pyrinomonadaceae bacterium]
MKIVRVIARLNVGGPARHVVWLTAGLRSADFESLLVAGTVPPGEEDMGYLAAEQGVEPILIPEMSREISPKDALTIWKLYRLFCRESPDIVHTHTAKAGTVGRIAGLLYRWLTPATIVGRPRRCLFVHTYHGHIFHSYYGSIKTRLFILIEKILARLITNRIVVVSEQQRREINETFGVGRPEQFAVIPLGLDLGIYTNPGERRALFRRELGARNDDVLVGIVGRLTEIKNHELFLRSAVRFKEKRREENSGLRVKFVVIGDGNLRDSLQAKAHAWGLAEDVVFVGSRRDPENFYAGLDIVGLTSLNEGTPLTLIEAMANKRPVIATAVGGVVDLLGEVTAEGQSERYKVCRRGLSVHTSDADGFAAGLLRLIKDPDLCHEIGNNGMNFVSSNYSRERLLEDIRNLYESLESRVRSRESKTHRPESGVESLESRVKTKPLDSRL